LLSFNADPESFRDGSEKDLGRFIETLQPVDTMVAICQKNIFTEKESCQNMMQRYAAAFVRRIFSHERKLPK